MEKLGELCERVSESLCESEYKSNIISMLNVENILT